MPAAAGVQIYDRMLAKFNLQRRKSMSAEDLAWVEYQRTGFDPFSSYAQISQDRIVKYNDYDLADLYGPIAVSLDIYAEEASQADAEEGEVVWVEAEDPQIEAEANAMLDRIDSGNKAYAIARSLAKYGDVFEFLLTDTSGVFNIQFVHPTRVSRVQTDRLLGFECNDLAKVLFQTQSAAMPETRFFQPWDFIHFRLPSDDRETVYGRSILESVRKTWKELQILETMIAVFRIVKAVERNVILVDVGDAAPGEARKWVERWRRGWRKAEFIDPLTGDFRVDLRGISPMEDLIIPIRPGSATRLEKLPPSPNVGAVEELQEFKEKLRATLGIPKAYLEQDASGMGWNAKEALVIQDWRFSKKIQRIRAALISGFTRLVAIHLTLLGKEWKPGSFAVKMAPVNQIEDRLREERWARQGELLMSLLPVAQYAQLDQKIWNGYVLREACRYPDALVEALIRVTSPLPGMTLAMMQGGMAGTPPIPGATGGGTATPVPSFGTAESIVEDVRNGDKDKKRGRLHAPKKRLGEALHRLVKDADGKDLPAARIIEALAEFVDTDRRRDRLEEAIQRRAWIELRAEVKGEGGVKQLTEARKDIKTASGKVIPYHPHKHANVEIDLLAKAVKMSKYEEASHARMEEADDMIEEERTKRIEARRRGRQGEAA